MNKKEKKPVDSYDDVWHYIYDFETIDRIFFAQTEMTCDEPVRLPNIVVTAKEAGDKPFKLFGAAAATFLRDYGAWLLDEIKKGSGEGKR